jgi:hypothetical protein
VRAAYAGGLDVMLWVCAGIAVTAALLALLFLPRRAPEVTELTAPAGAEPTEPGIPQAAGAE